MVKEHNYLAKNEEIDYYENAKAQIIKYFASVEQTAENILEHNKQLMFLEKQYTKLSDFENNFRIAVEVIVIHGNKALLCKRSDNVKVAPGIWNVPAGKVKHFEEIEEAAKRELLEEVGFNVDSINYFGYKTIDKESYSRIVYTYYTVLNDISTFSLDYTEFSTYQWVSLSNIDSSEYESIDYTLKQKIKSLLVVN